jgi:hypothetical protein
VSEPTDKPTLAGGGRYELRGLIGGGRTGIVYRAHDRELGRVVALKTLRRVDADALYRLKREFRTLARLAHPNLVQFFDLHVEGDERFFTMELVEGVDFVEHFRGRLAGDPASRAAAFAELRAALAQLAGGLEALHRHGTLHRDVKPANVLCERAGRVVLLDLGLASHVGPDDADERGAAGTIGYVAPEQLRGQGAARASDWYSAGAMLYEVLTGRLPLEGSALLARIGGRGAPPASPREIAPDTPADLDALAMALLEPEPARRAGAATVLVTVERDLSTPAALDLEPASPDAPFVGRDEELVVLGRALDESRTSLVALHVVGPSGIGKTALVERFADLARERGVLVLTARCHPQEAIPFKAVDGVIDGLAGYLAALDEPEVEHLVPEGIAALRTVFPVLARVPAVAAAPGDDVALDPVYGRRRAFGALREMLRRVAQRTPLVLWIDDLQWGDLDGAALLRELCRAPEAPPLLLLLSMTGDEPSTPPAVSSLLGDVPGTPSASRRLLFVGPLADDDARRLAGAILGGRREEELGRIVRAAQGSPLFVAELARCALAARGRDEPGGGPRPSGVTQAVRARVERLPAPARHVLELVAVAGRPLSRELAHGARAHDRDVRPTLALLHAQHLLRAVPVEGGAATTVYHQRIREAVLELVPDARRRELHLELAAALEDQPDADPRLLVDHYEQAGDVARAAELALSSAGRAAAELAFNQAADLYRRALDLGAVSTPRWRLLASLGECLTYAGRGAEGAARFAAAAAELREADPADPRAAVLERRAAEQYLRSGVYARGLELLRAVLADAGVSYPPTPRAALLSILRNRARLRLRSVLPQQPSATARDRERLEVLWSAGVGLSLFDMVRAADFQLRHALLAHRVGDRRHLARALATEAMTVAWAGGRRRRRRSIRLEAEAMRLAASAEDPRIDVQTLVMRSAIAFVERRFGAALELCQRGLRVCRERHVGTTWETANLELCAVSALACLGRYRELRARLPALREHADERGELYSVISLRLGFPNSAALSADDPDEARRQIGIARAAGTLTPFQEYSAVFAEAQVDLYAGDAFAGWQRTSAAWPVFRRAYLLQVQGIRIDLGDLCARCALRLAASSRIRARERSKLLRFVRRAAGRIARERAPWATPMVAVLRAGLAAAGSDVATAAALLEDAAYDFAALDMRAHAAAARLQRARLEDAPLDVLDERERRMRSLGIEHPLRMAAMLVPVSRPTADNGR